MCRNQHSPGELRNRGISSKQEQDKASETHLNEMEISDLPDREFKVMVIKVLTEVRKTMGKYSEHFNKDIENFKKYQIEITQLKTIITT